MGTKPCSRCLVAAVLAASLCASSCRRQEPRYDLLYSVALARTVTPTWELSLGTEAARAHRLEGWSWPERDDADRPFVWSHGPRSVLMLELPRLEAVLELRCAPYEAPDGSEQVLSAALNGAPLGAVRLRPGEQTVRLKIPATAVVPGPNRLVFTYARTAFEKEPSRRTPRRDLGVAFFSLRVVPASGAFAASPRPPRRERRELEIPAWTRLVWPVDLEPGARLELGIAAGRGRSHPVPLEVWLARPGAAPTVLGAPPAPGNRLEIPLPVSAPGAYELSLVATNGALRVERAFVRW